MMGCGITNCNRRPVLGYSECENHVENSLLQGVILKAATFSYLPILAESSNDVFYWNVQDLSSLII